MNFCRSTAASTAAGCGRRSPKGDPGEHSAGSRGKSPLSVQPNGAELPRGKGMILVSPEYANYASVMEMLRTGSKYPLLHARADGNEEAEEVERREIFLGLLE